MDAILQFVQQHPEAQAAVAGALVSVAMGVYKRLRPRAGDEETAKLRQALSVLAAAVVTGAVTTGLAGGGWWPALLLNSAAAWLASQATYGTGKTAQRLGNAVAEGAAAVAVGSGLIGGIDE